MSQVNLVIKQNNTNVEQVSFSILNKLYSLVHTEEGQSSSQVSSDENDIVGSINAPAAYRDTVEYLRNKFPNLTITVTDNNYYIRFDSEEFKRVCIEDKDWGDGTGMTVAAAAEVTSLYQLFRNNINENLNLKDLQYFTAINNNFDQVCYHDYDTLIASGVTDGTFNNPTVIQTLDVIMPPNRAVFFGERMFGVSWGKLRVVINSFDWNGSYPSSTRNSTSVFEYCKFKEFTPSLIPNLTSFGNITLFRGCIIDKCIFPEGVKQTNEGFSACSINYVEYPTTIEDIGFLGNFRRDGGPFGAFNNSGCIVIKAVVPPATSTINNNYGIWPGHIYVPDNSLEAYKNAEGGWQYSAINSRLAPMREMTSTEIAMGTVTQEDIDRV